MQSQNSPGKRSRRNGGEHLTFFKKLFLGQGDNTNFMKTQVLASGMACVGREIPEPKVN
jgi:hypothetical protein